MSQTDKILQRLLELHPNKLIDLKLDRVERLLTSLDRPQDRLPPVIHVAGTNGKGSTIAHLRAFLEAAGNRVHTYTSPHLVRFGERIRLAGTLVSEHDLKEALELCELHNDGMPITYFEITTAAAFYLFSKTPADFTLVEVGLGGRFDATNVFTKPLGTIITPVSIDHTEFLGDNIGSIAKEKAGIFKRNVPAIIGPQTDAGRNIIEAEAEKLGVQTKIFGQDFEGYQQRGGLVYQDETGLLDLPLSALSGPFQIENASVAIAALRYFGLGVGHEEIASGLKNVSWPARFMPIIMGELFDILKPGQKMWLDGGHNIAGGEALAAAMKEVMFSKKRPVILIFGTYANKDARGYLGAFDGIVDLVITVPIDGERLAWPQEGLAELANIMGFAAQSAISLKNALQIAAGNVNANIIVCGSLHLAGLFLKLNKTPPE